MKKRGVWKCYYCGQKFDTKTKLSEHELTCINNPKFTEFPYTSNPRTAWLVLWIITMIVFVISILLLPKFSNQGQSILQMELFFGNIGLGIIAFFAMLISKNRTKNTRFRSILKYSIFVCLAHLIINPLAFAMEGNRNINLRTSVNTKLPISDVEIQNTKWESGKFSGTVFNKNKKDVFNVRIILKVSKSRDIWNIDESHEMFFTQRIESGKSMDFTRDIKTTMKDPWWTAEVVSADYYNGENIPTPTIAPTSIPKKTIKPTIVPVDIDPMVNCNISANCGGGTRKIKQSECINGICCQIGSSWIFYTSRQKCTEDQNKYNSNYTYPTYAPYPTYKPIPTFSYITPTPYATPTMSQEQAQLIIDQHNDQVQKCRNSVISSFDDQLRGCNIQFQGSAAEVCLLTVGKQRQLAYDNCGQIY